MVGSNMSRFPFQKDFGINSISGLKLTCEYTCFLRFLAVASDTILRRYRVIDWPAQTFSRRKRPNPAPGTCDVFTSSPGNRRGREYFRGWPANGFRKTFRRGKTTCTGSKKRTGGRLWRMVDISDLLYNASHASHEGSLQKI